VTESQRVRRCVYLARPCNVCGCAIVVNSKKAKEEGDVGNMAGLRCHRPNTCQNLLKEKNVGRGVEVDGTLVGDVAKRPHVAHITPIAGISQMLEAKESELNERRLSGWELQQQEEDLRIASGRPSFSGADDASLRSTLQNMVVVHPACNEKHEQECQVAGRPIDMCECL
jgi:hypothetical protein